jgi:hypothetical protein
MEDVKCQQTSVSMLSSVSPVFQTASFSKCQDDVTLGYDVLQFGTRVPTFRTNLLLPVSPIFFHVSTLNMGEAGLRQSVQPTVPKIHGVISKYHSCYTKCHGNVKSQYFQVKKQLTYPVCPSFKLYFQPITPFYILLL